MIKCQACGTQNLDSSQYCDECGDSLQKYKAPEVKELKNDEPNKPTSQDKEVPIFQSASVTTIGVPPEIEEEKKEIIEPIEETSNSEPESNSNNTSIQKIGEQMPVKSTKGIHAKLIIERGQSIGTEFSLSTDVSNIGRWDADNGVFPDVDLDAHDQEAKVSRKHARILFKGGQYMLEDLGSTNGTFINRGRRLIPGNPHILNDNDEIIVGKTFLRFQVI